MNGAASGKCLDHQPLVPTVVEDFDRDLLVLSSLERRAAGLVRATSRSGKFVVVSSS